MSTKHKKPRCDGCGRVIKQGEPCYALQSGVLDDKGEFTREDLVSQLFHIGHCLCHEEHGCH